VAIRFSKKHDKLKFDAALSNRAERLDAVRGIGTSCHRALRGKNKRYLLTTDTT